MNDAQLLDEVMTLIVAGHETSASALNWTWYLLGTHPAAAARLQAEIDAAPLPAALSLAACEGLRYTQAVIQEALRLYPPGWLLTRRTIAADMLSGYHVPAGAHVMVSPYLIQRHPAHWNDPDTFRPERFLEAGEHPRDRWIYIPFGAGPRHCVGESFAMYEMTVHLARVAQRLRLEVLDDGPPGIDAAINLRTRRDVRVQPVVRH
jgi:cytochrome P450